MENERLDESRDPQVPEPIVHSVAWCNPPLCQPDARGVPGRWHYALGDAIDLTLQDEVPSAGNPLPTLHVLTDQNGDDDPTYCLYSESAKASSRSGRRGMDLTLTRLEAERLRDELSRWLDVTA